MKKMIYSMVILLTAIWCVSCEDENDEAVITGNWNYEKPYFEFDYAKDSITLNFEREPQSIAVKDLKQMFIRMASEKMGTYFTGIEFGDKNRMKINIKMQGGIPYTLNADYKQLGNIVQVTLDSNDLKQLTHGVAPKIPAISFKCNTNGNQMLLYFDLSYIKTVYSMMSDQIINMVIGIIGIDLNGLNEGQTIAIKKRVEEQIIEIMKNTQKLEIGFTLNQKL
ncbi:MAG: hypothetical protein RSA53_03225 [Odoribacter sp.]